MATWQFDLELIPEEKLKEKLKSDPDNLSKDEIENLDHWTNYAVSDSSINKISNLLMPIKSWSENLKIFRDLDKTCLQLSYENDSINNISLRIDLREISKDLLSSILDFISENKLLAITDERKLVKPSIEDIIKEIKVSNAYKFLEDPEAFLESFKKDAID